ncbi:helix-turn-helix domain-containing protein [Ramlibacter sp.]|uniref:winged helix-turn-helix transcriptional regulator n=1 Tax=Ramlibacter sp. TaxID=1917967 RepID=UPI0025EFF852|nr:helix-turn-helix domain-containing protein [Ramlibacter sp.]
MGDKWTPIVLFCLADASKRYSELQRELPDISKKMLTQVLRALETHGLVERLVHATVPPQTEYKLTPDGMRLHAPVSALCNWASANEEFLDVVHRRAESAPGSAHRGVD